MSVNKSKKPINNSFIEVQRREREAYAKRPSAEATQQETRIEDLKSDLEAITMYEGHVEREVHDPQEKADEFRKTELERNRVAGYMQTARRAQRKQQAAQQVVAQKRYQTSIEKLGRIENIRSRVNEAAGDPDLYYDAKESAMQVSPSELRKRVESSQTRAASMGREIADLAARPETDDTKARMLELEAKQNRAIRFSAHAQKSMKLQRRMGLDPESLDIRFEKEAAQAKKALGGDPTIASQVGRGDYAAATGNKNLTSLNKVAEEFEKVQNEIIEKQKKLATSSGMTAQQMDNLRGELKDLSSTASKLNEVQEQAAKRRDQTMSMIGLGTMALDTGVSMYRENRINLPAQQRQNQIGYARLANQQYSTVRGALSGDQADLMSIMAGDFARAQDVNEVFKGREKFAQKAEAVSEGVKTGANIFSKVADNLVKKNVAGAVVEGTGELIRGGSAIANKGINIMTETAAGQTALQQVGLNMELYRQVRAVPASQRQEFVDYNVMMTKATRGAGSYRKDFLRQMESWTKTGPKTFGGLGMSTGDEAHDDILDTMSPEEQAAASAAAIGALGRGATGHDVRRARTLERAGYGNVEQYFQRAGALAQAGGGSGELEDIMQMAVAKGMDTSKAIDMMVSATSGMAEGFTRIGVDASGAIGAQLYGAIGDVKPGGEFAAIKQAQTALQLANASGSSDAMNIQNLIERQKIGQIFGATGTIQQRQRLQRLTFTDMNILQKGYAKNASQEDSEAAKNLEQKYGIGVYSRGKTKEEFSQQLDAFRAAKVDKAFAQASGDFVGTVAERKTILEGMEGASTLKEFKTNVGKAKYEQLSAAISGQVDPDTFFRTLFGEQGQKVKGGIDVNKTVTAAEEVAEFDAKAASAVRASVAEEIPKGMKAIADSMEQVFKKFTDGEAIKSWGATAGKMAKSFEVVDEASQKFYGAAEEIQNSAKSLTEAADLFKGELGKVMGIYHKPGDVAVQGKDYTNRSLETRIQENDN